MHGIDIAISRHMSRSKKLARHHAAPPSRELHFTRTNGRVDEAIDDLLALVGGIHQAEIVREIILAGLKAGQENNGRADLKLMNTSLKEMRFTSKIFGPYRHVRKVTVFGSARMQAHEPLYQMAQQMGRQLTRNGYMVITGGGPGIMQAVNEGAGPDSSFGVNIRLPFEQKPNPVLVGNPRHITYKYFFNRKVAFLKEADAVVLFPGGFGTLDEAMETMTLVQTGKRYSLPLILMDAPQGSYWKHWLTFLKTELLESGYIGEPDLGLFECVDCVEAAVAKINRFYARFHSLRYVGDRLVIRMIAQLKPEQVESLQHRFADLLVPQGQICVSEALQEEQDEPEIVHLPRLIIDFNRSDFGQLRQLIDTINRF